MRMFCLAFMILLFAATVSAQELQFADLGECTLENDEVIEDCRIGYRTLGELNGDRNNAVLVPTWFGGTSETWVGLIEGRGVIDASKYFVIVVDALANGVSSSPSNSESQANDEFPQITTRDMVRTQHRLVTEVLGLDGLHAVTGMSMGGMQAFEWAVLYPDFMRKVAPIIGSPRLGAFDIATWETELRLLELYNACTCDEAKAALAGVGFITGATPERQNGMVSRDSVAAQLLRRGSQRNLDGGRSYDIARQLVAMIATDVSRGFDGDLAAAAASVQAEMWVMVGATDHLVTPGPALEFAELMGAETVVFENNCGHGAPTCEFDRLSAGLDEFLGRER